MTTNKKAGVVSRSALLLLFGAITMAFGLLTLMGWLLELPLLASLDAGRMPMPPSTALLFLLLGFATCLCARTPLSRRAFRISVALGWLVALVALPLFTLNGLNIHPAVEHFGLSAAGTVGGMTIGHMSPVTAFCFLLASLSFLTSLSQAAHRCWRVWLAFTATGLLLGLCFVFLLAYGFGTPLLYDGTFIPSALGTILAFITQGSALLVLEQAQLAEMWGAIEERHRSILQTAMDGFWRVDMQGRLLEVNDAYCRMSGYRKQELLAMRISDVEVVEAADDTIAHLQKVVAQGEDRFESRQRRKDGSFFDVEVSVQYRHVNGGECVTFLRDITARKRMQNEVLQISDWEKHRIGQDLHDILGQQLIGVSFLCQALASAWKSQPGADTDKTLAQLVVETRHTVELVRQVARGLVPGLSGPNDLSEALRGVTERAQQIHGVACEMQVDGDVTVADHQMATHLYFLAQEAVSNAVRHGQARHIVVRLKRTDARGELSIEDDGIGIPVGHPANRGMGLQIMRYRAELIGGELAIGQAKNGGGTRVVCRFGDPSWSGKSL
jgi:PAS domain S-box-containing protein